MLETRDVAWLAGLLEGEGCFTGSEGCEAITIHMTDEDVVRRAARLLGGGCAVKERARFADAVIQSRKRSYAFSVVGTRAIAWMMTLYPLLGSRRAGRVRGLISTWKSRPPRNGLKLHCIRGHRLAGENLRTRSKNHTCRACQIYRYRRDAERLNLRRREQRQARHAAGISA